MNRDIAGIHHITAISGDPQRNVDFYVGILGLRLVKKTVNFDDPGTYHLYYGDEQGNPGSILTFFPFQGAPQGRRGVGQATTTSFSVPQNSLGYWIERLKKANIAHEEPFQRFDEEVLTVYDPDDLQLELVASAKRDPRQPWQTGPVPAEQAIRGFFHVTVTERRPDATAKLMVDTMGFR